MPSIEPSSQLSPAVPTQKPSAVDKVAMVVAKLFIAGILVFGLLRIAALIAGLGVDDY